jgi:hypothetical protein
MNRRSFLKLMSRAAIGAALPGGYSVAEAKYCQVARHTIAVPRLPAAFAGLRLAFLSDIHHSRVVPRTYIRHVVALANAQKPDVILLGGDYITHGREWVKPCMRVLGGLRAPGGVFAVLGNHDHYSNAAGHTKEALRTNGIVELTNTGTWIERAGARLRLCGVGDFWRDVQDIDAALGTTRRDETALLLSHNPDYVEKIHDRRVGLVLSGHTHGGQVRLPFIGAPVVPSKFGQKYVEGLVRGPVAQVFVTRGVGTISPPVRFNCPPEVALLTLTRGNSERS